MVIYTHRLQLVLARAQPGPYVEWAGKIRAQPGLSSEWEARATAIYNNGLGWQVKSAAWPIR